MVENFHCFDSCPVSCDFGLFLHLFYVYALKVNTKNWEICGVCPINLYFKLCMYASDF
uniref:Ovule protein n=1 Tax=Parascaris univalens TaxID=6257 RepID=A0A915CK30_PARUN